VDFIDLCAPVRDLADGDGLSGWRWLVGADGAPCLLTALGDVFIQRRSGEICFLDTYEGHIVVVAASLPAWKQALRIKENISAWFTPGLVAELKQRGLKLSEGQSYSPIRPLILGGQMEPDNFECTPWQVHLEVMGQIYEKARYMTPGTPVTKVSIE
jgi:type VI secretion system (T6SS) immunity protein Tdi1